MNQLAIKNHDPFFGYTIQTDQRIGSGQFGVVVGCYHPKYQDKKLCVKIVQNQQQIDESFMKEIQILKRIKSLNNQHIVQVYDIFEAENKFHIVMELCNGGDVKGKIDQLKKLNNNSYFSTTQILDFIYQFLDGYKVLYDNNIMHRDIKPQNIFLDSNGVYKIGDLGAGRFTEGANKKGNYTKIGSPIYCSPQILQSMIFSAKTDIYSLGMMLYQMVFLDFPFKVSMNELERFMKGLKTNPFTCEIAFNQGTQEEKQEIKSLIEKMIVFDEDKRIGFEDLFKRVETLEVYKQFRKPNSELYKKSSKIKIEEQKQDEVVQQRYLHIISSILEASMQIQKASSSSIIILYQVPKEQFEKKQNNYLSFYLKVQYSKIQIASMVIDQLCFVIKAKQLILEEMEYYTFISSVFGYRVHLLKNIIAIFDGQYQNLSQHVLVDQSEDEIKNCLKDFSNCKSEEDNNLYSYSIFQHNQLQEPFNFVIYLELFQVCQNALASINKLKIRFKILADYKNLILSQSNKSQYQQFLQCSEQIYNQYISKYCQRQDHEWETSPDILLFFISNVIVLYKLEAGYPQRYLNQEKKKIELIPTTINTREMAINTIRNSIQQMMQQK